MMKLNENKLRDYWLHIGIVILIYSVFFVFTSPRLLYNSNEHWREAMIFKNDGVIHAIKKSFPLFEPAYPFFLFLVSLIAPAGMGPKVVSIIQCIFLFICALMMLDISHFFVKRKWIRIFVFYAVAVSPALLTSALTLYSEMFAAFWCTLAIYCAWYAPRAKSRLTGYLLGIVSALCASIVILSRAAFLYIFILTCLSVLVYFLFSRKNGLKIYIRNLVLYAVLTLIFPYLWMQRNEVVHGYKRIAVRGSLILSGSFLHSQDLFTPRDWLIETIATVSENAATALFKDINLRNYTWRRGDQLGYEYLKKINHERKIVDTDEYIKLFFNVKLDDAAMRQIMKDIISSDFPTLFRFFVLRFFQLIGLIMFETFCYDTVAINAVWLSQILNFMPLRIVARIGLSFGYFFGFIMNFVLLIRNWKKEWLMSEQKDFLLLAWSSVISYFVIYSFSPPNMRYTFVIAPVYILTAMLGWNAYLTHDQKRQN